MPLILVLSVWRFSISVTSLLSRNGTAHLISGIRHRLAFDPFRKAIDCDEDIPVAAFGRTSTWSIKIAASGKVGGSKH